MLVAAANDFRQLGIAGAVAISGAVSVAPGADVRVVNNDTKATVGDQVIMNASRDVSVTAKASESMVSVAAGIAGSGTIAVGGAVSVTVLNNHTHASLGNIAGTAANGSKISAGGNIFVNATDDTKETAVVGAAGVGIGGAGIGASVSVLVVNKDTKAWIGDNATVDAFANGPNSLSGIYTDQNIATGVLTAAVPRAPRHGAAGSPAS